MPSLQRHSEGETNGSTPLIFLFVTDEGNGTLKLMSLICFQLSNYNSFEGVLYCRPHFDQIFKRTGSLDKSFEGTNYKFCWMDGSDFSDFSF